MQGEFSKDEIDDVTASLITAGTPEAVVNANPKADMAVVYIRIEN